MRYLVKLNDIKEKVIYFEKQLDIITDNINNVENMKSIIVWEGEAASKFLLAIDLYSYRLRNMGKMVLSSIEYLLSFYDKYGSEYERLTTKYAYLLEEDIHG